MTNFETGSGREQQRSRAQEDQGQLRARVQFLTQENEELAQVNWPLDSSLELLIMIHLQRNDEILLRFDRVNSEKERLKNDIEELRHIRYPIT